MLPTCNKVDKVPGVVVEDGLEVLDKLLHDGLHHYPIVVPRLHTDHHLPEEEIKLSNLNQDHSLALCHHDQSFR